MVLNSCILFGFLLLFAADRLRLRQNDGLSGGIGSLGYAFLLISFLHFAFAPGPSWPLGKGATDFSPPAAIGIPAVLLGTGALFSALLLLWSVFFEFIWIRKKRGIAAGATVDSGTYSLCRHPGFWWLAFLAVFLGILRGIERYYITIILMIALDFLLVFIQDRYVFPRVFPDYLEYRKKVPFLVPRPRRGRTEPNGD